MPEWAEMVLVGRVARPHGLRGAVVINPETDFVEHRFAPGNQLWLVPAGGPRTVTVRSMRVHQGRPIVEFEGLDRIEAVQGLAGAELRVEAAALPALEHDGFYHHELIGCVVETVDGLVVGPVTAVEGAGAISRLIVDGAAGEVQIPFAVDICREVDVKGRRIRIAPPDGLLDVNR